MPHYSKMYKEGFEENDNRYSNYLFDISELVTNVILIPSLSKICAIMRAGEVSTSDYLRNLHLVSNLNVNSQSSHCDLVNLNIRGTFLSCGAKSYS